MIRDNVEGCPKKVLKGSNPFISYKAKVYVHIIEFKKEGQEAKKGFLEHLGLSSIRDILRFWMQTIKVACLCPHIL